VSGVAVLEADGVTVRFGGLIALDDVTLQFSEGRIHGVIGPNGAGKTTLLNVLSGLQRPTGGSVKVAGQDVSRWSPPRIVKRARVARTFQTMRLFATMSVRDNVAIAARCATSRSGCAPLTDRLLGELELTPVADRIASTLSYGLQRRVELARTLATQPRVVLLDEPAAGLSASEREDLARHLRRIRDDGMSIVLVEHHMDLVHAVCEDCAVLDFGEVIATGPTQKVLGEPRVVEAYLGQTSSLAFDEALSEGGDG
jgi:branched-chain amino acid transport system ATP-binding protein